MRPCQSVPDARDHGSCDAEPASHDVAVDVVKVSDRPDFIFRELISAISNSGRTGVAESRPVGMLHVFSGRDVAQIAGKIVHLVAIFMVDLLPNRARSQKCRCDQPMYLRMFSLNANKQVASVVKVLPEKRFRPRASPRPNLADTSMVADREAIFVSNYRSPFFGGRLFEHRGRLLGVMRAGVQASRPYYSITVAA